MEEFVSTLPSLGLVFILDEVLHYGSEEVVRGSGKPYYYINDLNGWGRTFVRGQVEIEALAYEKLLGFPSVPIELPHL